MRGKVYVQSGGPWEQIIGYSRAIRIGNRVVVAGTTAIQEQGVVGVGDIYKQTVFVLKVIEKALASVGAQMSDVIVVRIFVTDMSQWETVARAHREVFADVRPVTTVVEVKALIDPRLLVEIEVEAVLCE
ncbi:RidA family protein [Alicyclobacillus fastidiosus]|uniref:RidA family protein n=2 Tax=Alicyclobacillus fastidiosus TaxID=392011 RepID=A0ABY6ZEF7_9BACL|nr:RidA family protein [Alicyclobacillus fastidiosus]WAH40520.1 RidA family protein [Alicyclobacillus fastidiosus]